MSAPIRLKDIAQKVGVSTMTVSRALRGESKVSPDMRDRIQEVAREMGYRPNPLVSALMAYRRSVRPAPSSLRIAFLTNFPVHDEWRRVRIYREYFEGAQRAADQHGYQLEEFWLGEPGMSPVRMSKVLWTRNIRGIVLAPLPESQGHIEMNWDEFATVTLGYSVTEPKFDRACHHHFRSMLLAMEKAKELGYRRPGLALPAAIDDRVLHQWLGGLSAQQRILFKEKVQPFLVPEKEWNKKDFTIWLDRHAPDVVIGDRDELLDWIKSSGRAVPGDMGFINIDLPSPNESVTGIYENGPEIGVAAMDTLVAKLNRNERGIPALPRTILVEGSWVAGQTMRQQFGDTRKPTSPPKNKKRTQTAA